MPLLEPWPMITRYGGWLPSEPVIIHYLEGLADRGKERIRLKTQLHNPAVIAFQQAILSDQEMEDLFEQIFQQVAPKMPIRDFTTLLHAMDIVVDGPPTFHIVEDSEGNPTGEPIGVPMYILFDPLINTSAAYDLFRKPAYNAAMREVLKSWGGFLQTPPSTSSLNSQDGGWFSQAGIASLESEGRGDFNTTYVCDPDRDDRGYTSWDDFFTRKFRDGVRPIIPPTDPATSIIYNACESTVYRIARGVQLHDRFWLKNQYYSLYDMLNRDNEMARRFIDGTVYQAFLSPEDYHRWHSPVYGTVEKVVLVPGTYYAALPDDGMPGKSDASYGALIRSQAWLTMSATRALIYIQARNQIGRPIGLVCFIGVGMAEVSTCDITVMEGELVEPGSQLGMFHFGGSSHAVIFPPELLVEFTDEIVPNAHIKVNRVLARVREQPFDLEEQVQEVAS